LGCLDVAAGLAQSVEVRIRVEWIRTYLLYAGFRWRNIAEYYFYSLSYQIAAI